MLDAIEASGIAPTDADCSGSPSLSILVDIARIFNRITKYVATCKGADLTWNGSVALSDGAKDVAKLKQEDGPALVTQGSTELVHALLAAGLVDAIRVFAFPILLGKGKRLFDETSQPRAFKLTHSAVSLNGLIHGR